MGALLLAVLLLASPATAASLDDAARDIARRVLALLGPRDSLSISTPNAAALEASLQRLFAGRQRDPATVSLTVTQSRNARGPLLVAELIREGESTVLLAPYSPAPPPSSTGKAAVALEARLIREQPEPMLDVLVEDSRMAVLEPDRIAVYELDAASWSLRRAFLVSPGEPMPRDVRGRLIPRDNGVRAYLPGRTCDVSWSGDPPPKCDDGPAEWPLGLPATLVASRNYFTAPSIPPFYTAARWENTWVIAATSGPAMLDTAQLGDWGADIAALDAACSGERYLAGFRDGLQAFRIEAGNRAVAAGAPVPVEGRLAALWPSSRPDALTAIVESTQAGAYAAYRVSVACGR